MKPSDLNDKDLVECYMSLCQEVIHLPISQQERTSILFGFNTADILYVEKKNDKWIDLTPSGMQGNTKIDRYGNLYEESLH